MGNPPLQPEVVGPRQPSPVRPPVRERRSLAALVVVLGAIAPIAGFFALRLGVTYRTVLPMLALPWPWQEVVRSACIVLVVAAVSSAVAAVALGAPIRARGQEMLIVFAITTPIVLLLFFISIYGDPGPA